MYMKNETVRLVCFLMEEVSWKYEISNIRLEKRAESAY